jgi:hypothetical protein
VLFEKYANSVARKLLLMAGGVKGAGNTRHERKLTENSIPRPLPQTQCQ